MGSEHSGLAVADVAQRLRQLALTPQVADARVLQLGQGRRARNRARSLGFEGLRVHRANVSSAPSSHRSCGATSLLPTAIVLESHHRLCPREPKQRSASAVPTTRSRQSTTRGAGASSRTSTSTSPRRGAPAARSSSSASGPGGSRFRSRGPECDVIGVDSSAGMLEVAERRAEAEGVAGRLDLRAGDLRDPPVDERGRRSSSARSARSSTCRPTLSGSQRAPRGRDLLRPGRPAHLRRLHARRRRHRGDARPLARARARDLRARRLGHGLAHADALGAGPRRRDDDGARLARRRSSGACCSSERLRGGGLLRLVRPRGRTRAARTRSGSRAGPTV